MRQRSPRFLTAVSLVRFAPSLSKPVQAWLRAARGLDGPVLSQEAKLERRIEKEQCDLISLQQTLESLQDLLQTRQQLRKKVKIDVLIKEVAKVGEKISECRNSIQEVMQAMFGVGSA